MFQIVTDACCDVPAKILEEKKIASIPMFFELEGQEYKDDLGETLDYNWFLAKIKENAEPKTSQINVGKYMEYFRPFAKKNISILYVAFSSGLSGSYASSLTAIELLQEEYPNFEIVSLDTKAASLGEGMLVIEAARLRDEGKEMAEIAAWLERYKMHLRSWVTVNDLKQLVHGGRISKTQAALGGLLSIKPIINVDRQGKLQNVDKVRSRKKAIKYLLDKTAEELDLTISNCIYLAHSGDDEVVEQMVEELQQQYPTAAIQRFSLGPTIASHTGYGCIAIFSMGKEER